jgi:hypothetical protein
MFRERHTFLCELCALCVDVVDRISQDVGTTRVTRTATPTSIDLNAVARLHIVAHHGFRADAGDVGLAVGIPDVGEEHVPRHLAVNARRLDLFQNAVARAF